MRETVKRFGGLDVVFANAGVAAATPLGETTIETFEKVIRVNLTGVFFTVQSAVPHLREGGSVILNGSVHAVMGQPGHAAYAASKAAARSLTRTIASELAPRRSGRTSSFRARPARRFGVPPRRPPRPGRHSTLGGGVQSRSVAWSSRRRSRAPCSFLRRMRLR